MNNQATKYCRGCKYFLFVLLLMLPLCTFALEKEEQQSLQREQIAKAVADALQDREKRKNGGAITIQPAESKTKTTKIDDLKADDKTFKNKIASAVTDALRDTALADEGEEDEDPKYQTEKKIKNTKVARVQKNVKKTQKNITKTLEKNTGWIYLGRLNDNRWEQNTLAVDKELPKVAKNYRVVVDSVNMRTKPPLTKEWSKIIDVLTPNNIVQILKIRRSGRKGDYWVLVKKQTS